MDIFKSKPTFGGKLNTAEYYTNVDSVIRALRPMATLRLIADRLNSVGYRTPRGLIWDRQKVATYLRSTSI